MTDLTYNAYGDSLTAGFGATSSFPALIANRKGWTLFNYAADGACAWDQGAVAFNKTVTENQRFSVMLGINDQRRYSTGISKRANFALALREIVAWLAIPNSKKINAQDASVSYTGSWINTVVFGAWGRNSQTVGSTATFTVVGITVYIASLQQESQNAGFAVTIDGVTKSPTSADGTGMMTFNGATYGPTLYRYDGLSDGSHTVVLTVTGDGAGRTHFLWAAGNEPNGSQVFVGTATRSTQGFYDANGGSAENVAAYNLEIARVVNELRSDGLNVTLVDSHGAIDPATDLQPDGIHPNDVGQGNLADVFEAAMNGDSVLPPIPTVPVLRAQGTAIFSNNGTVAVSFGSNEPDVNYGIVLGCNAAERIKWSDKAVNGFVLNSDNDLSNAICDWVVVRLTTND